MRYKSMGDMKGIQFTTNNAFGEFCFYVTEERLNDFLNHAIRINPQQFKMYYTPEQARLLFEWLKKREQEDPTST
ncbi:hypothetical protein [Paenibacillus lautus]|uniref:hypothetical protein n=1 Tax=Paenibacillus lautus TaxID=1401 RepID=UPI003D2E2113